MEQAQRASAPGNTSTGAPKKVSNKRRNYMVTFWIKDYPKELPKNVKYLATCEDSTKDGKYHGHAFIYFKNEVTMKAVKKLFGEDCHCEIPIKNSSSIDYVLNKESRKHDFQEFGSKPMDNGIHNVQFLKELKDPSELKSIEYNTWKRIHDEQDNDLDIMDFYKNVQVYYIYGPSGSGKTLKATQIICDNIDKYGSKFNRLKFENNFWIGTGTDSKIALYDDFRDSHMKPSEFINFIDYNKQLMNVKGGCKSNNYELIIITSVQSPYEIYKNMNDQEPRKQWLRRMKIIKIEEEYTGELVDEHGDEPENYII